jgi:hypothetical protein
MKFFFIDPTSIAVISGCDQPNRGETLKIGLGTIEALDYTPPPFVYHTVIPQMWRKKSLVGSSLLFLLVLCAVGSGCVQRRMTVRSNPPGALVYVDDQPTPIGLTPVSHDFIYYGTRKFRLVKDGYETLTVMQSIPPPWYQYVPLDFVTENFVPGEIRDQHYLDFQMRPQMVVPPEQLLARAEELRRGIHATAGVAVPQGPIPRPQPGGVEVVPTPQGYGGQPVRPLPR